MEFTWFPMQFKSTELGSIPFGAVPWTSWSKQWTKDLYTSQMSAPAAGITLLCFLSKMLNSTHFSKSSYTHVTHLLSHLQTVICTFHGRSLRTIHCTMSTLLVCIYLLYIDSVTITLLILLLPLARAVDIICFKKFKEMQLVRVWYSERVQSGLCCVCRVMQEEQIGFFRYCFKVFRTLYYWFGYFQKSSFANFYYLSHTVEDKKII